MKRQWEYLLLHVGHDGYVVLDEEDPTEWDERNFKEVLPELGLLGWEMCGNELLSAEIDMREAYNKPLDVELGGHIVYFKREIEQLPGEELTMLATR
jgi:hypothetical protein